MRTLVAAWAVLLVVIVPIAAQAGTGEGASGQSAAAVAAEGASETAETEAAQPEAEAVESASETESEAAQTEAEPTQTTDLELAELERLLDELLSQLGISPATGTAGAPVPATGTAGAPVPATGGVGDLLPCLEGAGEAEPVAAADASGQVEEIARRVEEIRGFQVEEAITPTFLTPDEMRERVGAMVASQYTPADAEIDRRALSALGAIPPDTDLRALQAELLGSQVAGFYDSETGELMVAADEAGGALDTIAAITLAHELTHALVDQALGLPEQALEGLSDGALAALAFVEGDAVLAQQMFGVQAVSIADQLALLTDPPLLEGQAALEDAPRYLARQIEFPYLEGTAFVCEHFKHGGWDAVDTVYDDIPTTTAQILFPGRTEPAAAAPVPTTPSVDWRHVSADTIGAAQLLWLFEAPGGDPDAALDDPLGAVESWAGGRVDVWAGDSAIRDASESAVSLALTDVETDGALCDAVAEWYSASFPDSEPGAGTQERTWEGADQDAALRCDGTAVRLGIGPNLATATAILGEPTA